MIKKITKLLSQNRKVSGRADTKNLHASDMLSFCPRAYAISSVYDVEIKPYRRCGLSETFIYEIGDAIHTIVRKKLSPSLVGEWRCVSCGTGTKPLSPKPNTCKKCGNKLFSYTEHEIMLPIAGDINFVGHIDAVVKDKSGLYIIEIKSISKDRFAKLQEPSLENRHQLEVYLWLAKKMDKRLVNKCGYIIYVSKEASQIPFKVFEVKYNKSVGETLDKKVEVVGKFAETNKIPSRLCQNTLASLARLCKVRNMCFKEGE